MEKLALRLDQEDFFYQEAAVPVIDDIIKFLTAARKQQRTTMRYIWEYPIDPDVWFDYYEYDGYAEYEVSVKVTAVDFKDDHPGWNIDGTSGFGSSSEAVIDIDVQVRPELLGDTTIISRLKTELYNVVPHELHHLTQENQPFQRVNCPLTSHSAGSGNYQYFTSGCEVPAFLIGFRGEAHQSGRDIGELMDSYLNNQLKAGKISSKDVEAIKSTWLGHSTWKKSVDESVIRSYIRTLLSESAEEEPDLAGYVDTLGDMIMKLLRQKNVAMHVKQMPSNTESPTTLDTGALFSEYDNVNQVVLVLSVNDQGSAQVNAAYLCDVKNRSKSNLMISLDVPRDYMNIPEFEDWIDEELADAFSHELQHSCDPTEMLFNEDCGDESKKWDSLENMEKYYGCEAEVRGHVAGILGRGRKQGQRGRDVDYNALLDNDLSTVFNNAISRGYNVEELTPVMQRIYQKWKTRLDTKTG